MAKEEEVLLGRIAVAGGLISRKQLDECLSYLEENEFTTLGEILLKRGYLDRNQLESILQIQGRDPEEAMPPTPEDTRTLYESSSMPLFGKMVLKKDLATKKQVEECLKIQKNLEMTGKVYQLGEIMVKKGYISPEEVREILKNQRKQILRCEDCETGFNYPTQIEHKDTKCPKCGGALMEEKGENISTLDTVFNESEEEFETLIGKNLGGCVLEERIGRGSMASVYRGVHLRLEKPMAVKLLHVSRMPDQYSVRQFIEEAKMAAKLEHENIVRVYNAGEEEGIQFIQMELLDGTSLKQILDERYSLMEQECLEILENTASGLAYAHKHDIIHRDIKPENIMITDDGEIKITDFGLARYQTEVQHIGEDEPVSGTPYFMSPEQWKREPLDQRSDIYSLGITCYRALTGKYPFEARNLRKLMNQHLSQTPESPRSINQDISHEISSVIEKMIEKEKPDRYESGQQLLNDLQRIKGGLEPRAMLSTGQTVECNFCNTINLATRDRCKICNEILDHEIDSDLEIE